MTRLVSRVSTFLGDNCQNFSLGRIFHKSFYLILMLSSFIIAGSAIINMGFDYNFRALYPDMIDGSASKPFVTRSLIPQTIHLISISTPNFIKEEVNSIPMQSGLIDKLTKIELNKNELKQNESFYNSAMNAKAFVSSNRTYDYLIGALILYLSIFLFTVYFRKLLKTIYVASDLFYDLSLLITQILVTACFLKGFYFYDFTTLFLATLFVYLLLKEKWALLLIEFTFFAFHKETSIFFLILFIIMRYKDFIIERKRFLLVASYMSFVYISARLIYGYIFRNNPGVALEYHILYNIFFLMSKITLAEGVSFIVLLIFIFRRWNIKPISMQKYFYISFFFLIIGMVSGLVQELRQYYEVYPAIASLIAQNVAIALGVDVVSKESKILTVLSDKM